MPKRLTKEIINDRLLKDGYKCLDYNISTKKFKYICSKGHTGNMRMDHWNRGVRCATCAGNKKFSFKEVEEIFNKEGYILLSKEYKNNKSILVTKCKKGHIHKISLNNFRQGYRCPICYNESIKGDNNPYILSGAIKKYKPEKHYNWKGGVVKKNLPLYSTYGEKLSKYHKVYKIVKEDLELLGVECVYCGKIYVPLKDYAAKRLQIINGTVKGHGSYNFYCSENCKKACPTYGQKKYPKGFKPITSREVQPALRKLVLKRDNYQCQICNISIEEAELHCHHITGVEKNPIESADLDNCITLCKKHHKQVHKLPECGYNDLKCS